MKIIKNLPREPRSIKNTSRQEEKFPEIIMRVIDESDILLELVDARFVSEMRNSDVEEIIKKKGKKIIYVLNKSDLAERKEPDFFPYVFVSCKLRKGISKLRKLIKIEASKINKDRVYVGVLGYPNTGKSSLINLLTRRGSAKTSPQPGFTKGMQKIRLVHGILLLDSPGVIPEKEYSTAEQKSMNKHTKLGARSYNKVKNPEFVINSLVKEYPKSFENFYKIDIQDPEILIEEIGRKKRFLLKGNQVDTEKTARQILREWQEGKIRIVD